MSSNYGSGSYTERLEDHRQFWKLIVFGLLTCGIYTVIYCYRLVNDINAVCRPVEPDDDDNSPNYIVVALLTGITCGIYGLFWFHKQGDRIKRAGKEYGVDINETGTTLLLWLLLGSLVAGIGAFMVWYILTANVNRLAKAYNYRFIDHKDEDEAEPAVPPVPPVQPVPPRIRVDDSDVGTSMLGARGTLKFIKGEYKDQTIDISGMGTIVIGRSGQYSQLILLDPTVSRKHCAIQFKPSENAFFVTDYSSRGTWMNGSIRLQNGVPVRCPVGSRLTLGDGKNEILLQ